MATPGPYHLHKRPMKQMTNSGVQPRSRSFVCYYRVSTRRQGRSGLGIDAQKRTVADFVRSEGGRVVEEFVELESGRRKDRPQLAAALSACRVHQATLVVAKLDRLARNAAFLLSLRDAGVDLCACDLPGMNRMTVGIMAVVAEEEARMIADRTRAALQAAKRRGVILGTPGNLSSAGRKRGNRASAASRANAARARASDLMPLLIRLRERGASSLRELADGLNTMGIRSARGASWTPTAVRRVLQRL